MKWLASHKKRISEIGTGQILYWVFNWVFNNPVYLAAIAYFGIVKGGLIMSIASFLQCALLLVVFDRMKIDWVGVTYLQDISRKEEKKWVEKALVWALRRDSQGAKGKLIKLSIFATLSAFVDPFLVAVHYRRSHFEGVTGRDWAILTASVFIANAYWTLRQGILVAVALEVWRRI